MSRARRRPTSRSRQRNPQWTLQTTAHDNHGHRLDTFRSGSHKADLHYLEEGDGDGDIIIVQVNGYWLESDFEDAIRYKSESSALAGASKVAKLFDDRRVKHVPGRGEDWESYLEWFKQQSPNQADYVVLLSSNDPNGSYDNLLMAPLSEAEDVFDETFGEYQSNPEPGDDDDDDDDEESLDELARRYYHPAYEQFGEPNPRENWVVVAPINREQWPVGPLEVMTRDQAIIRLQPQGPNGRRSVALRGGFDSQGKARSYADKVEHTMIEVIRPSDGTVVYRGSVLGFSDDPAARYLKYVDRSRVLELVDTNVETKLGQGKKALIGRRDRGENPYMGDAVELAKQRKYEEQRRRWEKEGRRGPPPAPPRNPSDDEPPKKRKPRKGNKKIFGYVYDGILYDTKDQPTKWGVSEYLGQRGGRTWYLLTMYQGGEEVGFLLGSEGSDGVFEGFEERNRKIAMKVFESSARQKNPREGTLARRIGGR